MPIDMSAAKAPPKKTTTTRATSASQARSSAMPTRDDIRNARLDGLNGLAQIGQGLCIATGQWADAATIGMHAEPLLTEVAKLADTNAVIAKPIDFLIQTGPYAALIQAAIPFAMQIAVNHGWIKASGAFGAKVVPPEVLEAQFKTAVMRQQAETMRQQQAAMEDYRRAEAAMMAAMNAQQQNDPDATVVMDAQMRAQSVPDVQTNGRSPL